MELLARVNLQQGRNLDGIATEAMDILQNNDWPCNIRKLSNIIERGAVVCCGDLIGREHLPLEWQTSKLPSPPRPGCIAPTTLYRKIKAWKLL